MGVGGLIAGLCGLCTGGFVLFGIGNALVQTASGHGLDQLPTAMSNVAGFTAMSLVIGAVPIVVGLALFVAGRGLHRSAPRPAGA